MIKLLTDIGSNKSGEIVTFSKRKEQKLVSQEMAIFVKLPELCIKQK